MLEKLGLGVRLLSYARTSAGCHSGVAMGKPVHPLLFFCNGSEVPMLWAAFLTGRVEDRLESGS